MLLDHEFYHYVITDWCIACIFFPLICRSCYFDISFLCMQVDLMSVCMYLGHLKPCLLPPVSPHGVGKSVADHSFMILVHYRQILMVLASQLRILVSWSLPIIGSSSSWYCQALGRSWFNYPCPLYAVLPRCIGRPVADLGFMTLVYYRQFFFMVLAGQLQIFV